MLEPKPCAFGTCPPSGCQVGTASGCCGPIGWDGADGLTPLVEDECEPTAQSCREPLPPPVAQLVKHKPNEDVIELLERVLAYARAGELIGVVVFGNHVGNEDMGAQAGDTDFPSMLAAFEDWKFRRVWRRNRTDEPE